MAVSKVRKLELVAHTECRDEILAALRSLAAVHISDVSEVVPEYENDLPSFLHNSLVTVKDKLAQILYCILFLERFKSKSSLAETLFKSKPMFSQHDAEETVTTFAPDDFYQECVAVEKELGENEGQIEKKETLASDISLWLPLDCPFELIQDTETTRVSLGICEPRAFDSLVEELMKVSLLHHVEVVKRSRASVSMVLIYCKEAEEAVLPVFRKHGWHSVRFIGITGAPAAALERLREQIRELQERNDELRERVCREMVPLREKLLLLHDHYSQMLQALEAQQNFLFTSRTFLVTGWVVAKEEKRLRESLGSVTEVVEIRCSDPAPDDDVPILLENNAAAAPFSLITQLYGRPQYTEFDPTPFFAPFFALFFGICLGDAGYGAVLAIGSFFALKKFNVSEGSRQLLKILVWGGIASVVVGLLTGGIFCVNPEKLPRVFKSLIVLNATKEVLLFLYVAFALGLIQVLFGIGIKLALSLRQGDVKSAIMDQALWIIFLASVAPLVYETLFGGSVNATLSSFAASTAKVLAVALILTQGRKTKFLLFRPFMGLLKLYGVMGYFGDVLSYARLMALGLATAFLGATINDMAGLFSGIPYGLGYVFAAVVLVFGHVFNLAINCLGAFVHSLRLQYLEFFSKFFAGGGKPFEAFSEKRQYTIVQSGVQ